MSAWGCSLDGYADAIAKPTLAGDSAEIVRGSVVPACAILPENSFNPSVVNEKAQHSRICRGYTWPPESRFTPKIGGKRLVISLAWQLLVAAGDRRISWQGSESSRIPIANPIADHIVSFLPQGVRRIVLAIPNNLHEFGQKALIDALRLRRKNCEVTLLWRPVAAAISWCHRLPPNEAKRMVEKDDNLLTIHLGADGFEFVPLRLRKDERNGIKYVVPLRTRPPRKPTIAAGTLVFASAAEILIEKMYGKTDQGAIWQAFAIFPDLWKRAKGEIQYNEKNLEFIQVSNTWEIWKPHDHLEGALQSAYLQSEWLEMVIRECCKFDISEFLSEKLNLTEYVRQGVRDALSRCQGDVVGAVITGNLEHLPCGQDRILKDIVFEELEAVGLEYEKLLQPAGTYIYYPDDPNLDLVAEGCLIYYNKLLEGLPTYYDTLPKLDIRARVHGKPQWCPLVKADVVEGGKTHEIPTHEIPYKFAVEPGQVEIDFFLRREDADEFRKLPFTLPAPASTQIGLDLKVTMQPAQGFASVEVIPSKAKAFGTEQIYLDWSRMSPSPLPPEKGGIGYPETFPIETHPEVYSAVEEFLKKYLWTDPSMPDYLGIVEELRDEIKKPRQVLVKGEFRSFRLVDENGNLPAGVDTTVLKGVIEKMGTEIQQLIPLKMSPQHNRALEYLRQAAAWLYAAAPENCYAHIREVLKEKTIGSPPDIVHAAGRSFIKEEDIKLFFSIAIRRIEYSEDKTNYWVSSISRILQHREHAPKCLNRKQALFLAEFACRRMQSQLEKGNIKQIFKNSAHLFLYLLRWRTVGAFLEEGREYELGQQTKDILKKAADLSGNKNIQAILEEMAKYIEYQGGKYIIGFPEDVSEDSLEIE